MFRNIKFLIALCLTLGLAPFFPEPHLWGKLQWIIGGGKGMEIMDYFDLVMHGTPWVLLVIVASKKYLLNIKKVD